MARCSICGTLIQPDEAPSAVTQCTECQQDYHQACWDDIGGCATYGCKSAAAAEKPPPPVIVGGGWGDTKTCPSCNMNIASSLLVCSCGARFPYADPMSIDEYHAWAGREHETSSSKKTLVSLFVLSLLGFPAPVTGPIAGIYAFSRRKQLEGANGTFLAIGYGAAALGVTYGLFILALALGL